MEMMEQQMDFSQIAPYGDQDVRRVLDELKNNPSFLRLLQFVDQKAEIKALSGLLDEINTIDDFQSMVAHPWMRFFLNTTSDEITHTGLELVSKGNQRLFISNHRDIILDSAILNVLLFENDIQTVETAIGDNLLTKDVVHELTKLNKNFTVIRSAGPREMYNHSLTLSTYIRSKITTGDSSIWLAQREGRAKNGFDKTQQGLLKMLNLSNEESFEEGMKHLNIHPLSLSYEYDPCDRFKLREIMASESGEEYVKEDDEDFENIIAGLSKYKGRIHLAIRPSINPSIDELDKDSNVNDKTTQLAEIIDKEIYASYKLFENNYVAFDMLYGLKEYQNKYSNEDKEKFEDYIAKTTANQPIQIQKILLRKYAYPLINQKSVESSN